MPDQMLHFNKVYIKCKQCTLNYIIYWVVSYLTNDSTEVEDEPHLKKSPLCDTGQTNGLHPLKLFGKFIEQGRAIFCQRHRFRARTIWLIHLLLLVNDAGENVFLQD